MEFFKSGLKSVLGSQETNEEPSGAETVERLVERVFSSTLLDDRRDACRALKALSRKYRIEVGAQGMDVLRNVLETDRGDCEIVGYALDTLCNITAPQVFEEEERPELSHEPLAHVGEQFTEMFIKSPDNVSTVLSFLEEYDFKVRWPALKLLSSLLSNRLRDIQEIILVSPMGVSKLMDLLGDSREVIRNDTLLLLAQLTKGNANIQKIVAFENAFDRLFSVIMEEGYSDGGIVVEDCLLLMLNLLRNNTSNQNFFKEGSYIQKLIPMFDIPPESEENQWSAQKVLNIDCVLQVVRCLVSPANPGQVTSGCQRVLRTTGILVQMCNILMASGVPVDVLTEAICAVGETVRGNQPNQEFFATFMAPSTPPREALVVLLMSMVNEKQPFALRCSVLYCFQCYLFKNEVGQAQIVQTLLPSATEVGSVTCGQLLCSGLFSHDSVSTWLSSVALSHCLIENPQQKEQLLRVLLAPAPASQPVSLIQQLAALLHQCSKVQSKVGLLILLCTWMSHCPLAIKHFLGIQASVPYLILQAGSNERDDNEELLQGLCAFLLGMCVVFNDDSVPNYTKENLKQLVLKRVGFETFLSKLSEVSRHEQYSKSVKQPQPPKSNTPPELLLDYEFCKLFKALEGMIHKSVSSEDTELSSEGLLSRYKEVIREQDRRLRDSEIARQDAETSRQASEYMLSQADALIARLNDENTILRAQVSAGSAAPQIDSNHLLMEIDRLKNELLIKDGQIIRLEEEVKQNQLTSAQAANNIDGNNQLNGPNAKEELAKLQSDQDDLLELLADQEQKIAVFKKRLKELGEEVDDEGSELDDPTPDNAIPTKLNSQQALPPVL